MALRGNKRFPFVSMYFEYALVSDLLCAESQHVSSPVMTIRLASVFTSNVIVYLVAVDLNDLTLWAPGVMISLPGNEL